MCKLQIWISYAKAFESYPLTDRQTESSEIVINLAASQVVNTVYNGTEKLKGRLKGPSSMELCSGLIVSGVC